MKNKTTILAGALMLALLAGCASQPAAPHATAAATPTVATAPAPQAYETPIAGDAARLLPLQGALNARNFGDLQGAHGAIPTAGFVRTADLSHLTAADRDALASDGVALDVDLRTADEETRSHDVLADDARFKYVRISLMGVEKIDMSHMPDTLGEMYVQSLDANQAQFRQVFQTIAAQPGGTVLFHCTAGKDRTGMISALLLDLAGVPKQDIVHNYAISAYYLKPMMAQMARDPQYAAMAQNPKFAAMMGTPPEAIDAFLGKLDAKYGGAKNYLRTIGLSDAEVQALLARLGQNG